MAWEKLICSALKTCNYILVLLKRHLSAPSACTCPVSGPQLGLVWESLALALGLCWPRAQPGRDRLQCWWSRHCMALVCQASLGMAPATVTLGLTATHKAQGLRL